MSDSPATSRASFIVKAILVGSFIILIGVFALRYFQHHEEIVTKGTVVTAHPAGVTSVYVSRTNRSYTDYRAEFTYYVDDEPYIAYTLETTEAAARADMKNPDPQVHYLKSDPSDGVLSFGSTK